MSGVPKTAAMSAEDVALARVLLVDLSTLMQNQKHDLCIQLLARALATTRAAANERALGPTRIIWCIANAAPAQSVVVNLEDFQQDAMLVVEEVPEFGAHCQRIRAGRQGDQPPDAPKVSTILQS
jgi:hypothetical protein